MFYSKIRTRLNWHNEHRDLQPRIFEGESLYRRYSLSQANFELSSWNWKFCYHDIKCWKKLIIPRSLNEARYFLEKKTLWNRWDSSMGISMNMLFLVSNKFVNSSKSIWNFSFFLPRFWHSFESDRSDRNRRCHLRWQDSISHSIIVQVIEGRFNFLSFALLWALLCCFSCIYVIFNQVEPRLKMRQGIELRWLR